MSPSGDLKKCSVNLQPVCADNADLPEKKNLTVPIWWENPALRLVCETTVSQGNVKCEVIVVRYVALNLALKSMCHPRARNRLHSALVEAGSSPGFIAGCWHILMPGFTEIMIHLNLREKA